ncbi:MAG TPA: hypothetical protein VFX86_01460 [Candidatus Saccharimonadales bacterium]|nr:hypothetical protein [Candidatus Saccharimonadales bacterium]
MKAPFDFYENGFGYIRLENLKLNEELPDTITVESDEMVKKPEFHISLVWVGRLAGMINEDDQEVISVEMIKEFEKFIKKYSLTDYKLTRELRLVRKGEQKTVIAMVSMPNLDIFFEKLSKKYDVNLPVQPTHITLYTLPTDKIGIGILSFGELDTYSEPINITELQSLL